MHRRFEEFGFPLITDRNVIPRNDDTTLFVCSGMQQVKRRFHDSDGGRHGSLQSCIRTDDLELIGDGSHLTYFEMLGNFSFGGGDYEESIELWHSILTDLQITETCVRVHPSQSYHRRIWTRLGYEVLEDEQCVWSDGTIGGYCCEVFVGDLEIGNLVNTLGHSTDVGFGWERLVLVMEGKDSVFETSIFDPNLDPIVSDHSRTISMMIENGIEPGSRGRNYVCRRLLRRILHFMDGSECFSFDDQLQEERQLRDRSISQGRRFWRRHKNRPSQFWWETFGIMPEELRLLE
ncbi:MAG: alanine--tRNA ligase-related protein [Planctomycetota bacterium]